MSQYVVVGSATTHWVDSTVASKVGTALSNGVQFVTIDGNIIASNTIRGILKPEDYIANAKVKRQSWRCRFKSVHQHQETCACKRRLEPTESTQIEESIKLSPHQIKVKEARSEAIMSYIRSNLGNLKALKDDKARKAYVDQKLKDRGIL